MGPIALYPDGLLAQVLTASTFSNEIPNAAGWANAHQYLRGDQLAQAIQADNLAFDPSVMALLPFPSVLNYMAQYMGWTQALGNAVLAQRDQLMDAAQRLRQEAYSYGYLRDSQYVRVVAAPELSTFSCNAWILLRSLLQPGCRVWAAKTRVLRRRSDSLWRRNHHWRFFCSVGLGCRRFRLAAACHPDRQSSMGTHLE